MTRTILVLLMMVSSTAFAADKLGPYAGLGVGVSYVEVDPRDRTVVGAHLDLGYRYTAYLATEGSIGISEARNSDVTAYSAAISVLPMLPVSEDMDIFLAFSYSVATSNDFLEVDRDIEDGFGVGIGFIHHMDNIYVRGRVSTPFSDAADAVGVGLDLGFKF